MKYGAGRNQLENDMRTDLDEDRERKQSYLEFLALLMARDIGLLPPANEAPNINISKFLKETRAISRKK